MATLFVKGISKAAKNSGLSPTQAQRVLNAIKRIQSSSAENLIRSRSVKKIRVAGRDDVYLYRVDARMRVVLSINKSKNETIVHSVVDADRLISDSK